MLGKEQGKFFDVVTLTSNGGVKMQLTRLAGLLVTNVGYLAGALID